MSIVKGLLPSDIGAAPSTTEALSFPVDYNDVTAVDPTAGLIFTNQQQIDRFLANNTATNFKHLQAVIEALPILSHLVRINCASGVHRPRTQGEMVGDVRLFFAGGRIEIHGEDTPANWTSVHAGGTITGHQLLDEVTGVPDPYLDFAASTFPNDGSLNGKYVVLDNGFVSVIWGHTDSRLWLCRKVSPAPTNGVTTVFVAEPSTIFRNSVDDLVMSSSSNTLSLIMGGVPGTGGIPVEINSITFHTFTSFAMTYRWPTNFFRAKYCHIDDTAFPPENSFGFRALGHSSAFMNDWSHVSTVGAGTDIGLSATTVSSVRASASYIQGCDDGAMTAGGVGSRIDLDSVVLRGAGGNVDGAVRVSGGANFDIWDRGTGVRNLILEAQGGLPALDIKSIGKENFFFGESFAQIIRFRDCTGPCVRIGSSGSLSFDGVLGDSFLDDGGNLDVGVDFAGVQASVDLPVATNVTGSNGDVRIAGEIETWSDIAADGPFIDLVNGNRIKQV